MSRHLSENHVKTVLCSQLLNLLVKQIGELCLQSWHSATGLRRQADDQPQQQQGNDCTAADEPVAVAAPEL